MGDFVIPDVDVAKGISMTGGMEKTYKKVLGVFYKDAVERLSLFEQFTEGADIKLYSTQFHALKSASGSIGAAAVSQAAADLEAAGNNGDAAGIEKKLPGFIKQLTELCRNINKALSENAAPQQQAEGATGLNAFLQDLQNAVAQKNIDEIDQLVEKLENLPLKGTASELVNRISDFVLAGDYEKVTGEINSFKKE
ncbi:hypothetical protein FACS189494_01790 [Spirochaetia bacterium]|nr:hypothetical protein FACS189494_01790 [Spirochaetia bacterium]